MPEASKESNGMFTSHTVLCKSFKDDFWISIIIPPQQCPRNGLLIIWTILGVLKKIIWISGFQSFSRHEHILTKRVWKCSHKLWIPKTQPNEKKLYKHVIQPLRQQTKGNKHIQSSFFQGFKKKAIRYSAIQLKELCGAEKRKKSVMILYMTLLEAFLGARWGPVWLWKRCYTARTL